MTKQLYLLTFLISTPSWAQPPAGYYDNANGLNGYALKSALETIIDDVDDGNGQSFHDTSVTYSQLWTLYETSDDMPDGTVWDMYSNCVFNFVVDQDTGTGGTVECDKFNREHTFPRSWFGDNSSHPIYADAYHVIPTDKKVNAERGNLAYGEVAVASYTSSNNSKVGSSSLAGPTGNVFEPADEYKGDIARGYFYLAVRYQDDISSWEANDTVRDGMLDGSSDKVFEQWALDMLYNWHIKDPVSQKELDRNDDIFVHHGNRNPLIDNPQYVEDIWQATLGFDEVEITESLKMYPKPISDKVLNIYTPQFLTLSIYNALGIRDWDTSVFQGNNQISLPELQSGIYFLNFHDRESGFSRKLIKQ